jgi:diacylglycerol kinase family enzyme
VTIRPGASWGTVGAMPAGARTAANDREAASMVEAARRTSEPAAPVHLLGGDLWRTCGGVARAKHQSADRTVAILPVDVGVATIDGREHVFVAHVVARSLSAWFGPLLAVCNAEYIGRWDIAPRSHPGDGRLDVVEVDGMPLADRWRARRRLPTGTHVPHPAISQRRAVEATFRFPRPRWLWLDGYPAGRASELTVRVEAAALTVCV